MHMPVFSDDVSVNERHKYSLHEPKLLELTFLYIFICLKKNLQFQATGHFDEIYVTLNEGALVSSYILKVQLEAVMDS